MTIDFMIAVVTLVDLPPFVIVCSLLFLLLLLVFAGIATYQAITHVYWREYRELPPSQDTSFLYLSPKPYNSEARDDVDGGVKVTLVNVDGKGSRGIFSKVRSLVLRPGTHNLVFDVWYACMVGSSLEDIKYLDFRNVSLTHTFKAGERYLIECKFIRENGEVYTSWGLTNSLSKSYLLEKLSKGIAAILPQKTNVGVAVAPLLSLKPITLEAEDVEIVETEDATYWYNKGCEILGIGAQPSHHKTSVISQGDSFDQSLRQAILCFNKALKVNPEYVDAWVNKGSAMFYLGQNEEALQCAKKALSINPNLEAPQKLIAKIEGY